MNIKKAKYLKQSGVEGNSGITAIIDDESMTVPLDTDNVHYAEILKQVKEGTLKIQEAD
tara:strand:- start:698 stop:874 length:177 start_codon:yes stop_codon:yes gene_type:complete